MSAASAWAAWPERAKSKMSSRARTPPLLRDAIARAGGFRRAGGFLSPLDLVEIGLMSTRKPKDLRDLETSAASGNQ
jgi:hypothetical protein